MSRYYHTITVDNYKFQFDYSITTLPGCCGIGVIYNFRVDCIYDLDSGESLHPKDVEDGIIPEKTLSRFKSRVRQTLSRSAKARYSMVMASDVEYARDISQAYYSVRTRFESLRLRDILQGYWDQGPVANNRNSSNNITHFSKALREAVYG